MKTNPHTINPPSRLPRSLRWEDNRQAKDLDRVFAALERLHMWQCPCCFEIFPQSTKSVFGACEDCFIADEEVHDKIDLDTLTLHEIARVWSKWSREVYNAMPNLAVQTPPTFPTRELLQLQVFWSIVGGEKMLQALKTTAASGYWHPDKLTFVNGVGIVPRGIDYTKQRSRAEWKQVMQAAMLPVK
jgi:hypothetical protein